MSSPEQRAEITKAVDTALHRAEERWHQYQNSAFKRFPILFTLATSFGVVATFFGIEGIIQQIDWLHSRPWLILVVGIATLALTGTLYKKLG